MFVGQVGDGVGGLQFQRQQIRGIRAFARCGKSDVEIFILVVSSFPMEVTMVLRFSL